MGETVLFILLAVAVIIVVLQLVLILRKTPFETPADLNVRLGLLEQSVQSVVQTTTRSQVGSDRIEQQLRTFTETTAAGLEASRRTLDEKLDKTVDESRNGRGELLTAFRNFESSVASRLVELQKSTGESLETNRLALDTKLTQTLEESRGGRAELASAFLTFEGKLEQRIQSFDASMTGRSDSLQQTLLGRLDEAGKAQLAQVTQAQADAAQSRKEMTETLATFRNDLTSTLKTLSAETLAAREALARSSTSFEKQIQERFEALAVATKGTLDSLKSDIGAQLGVLSTALKDQLQGNGNQIHKQFSSLQDAVAQQLTVMAQGSHQSSEQLRTALNDRLASIQADNTAKLEEMRRTVDEKLHATLEQRLGDSFKLVSERLEQVHAGLGEMKSLAGSVGDLKRVMTNVRTRGTWGEVQLGAIIEGVLTAEQFAKNVKTTPGSNDVVEYAIKMPGKSDDQPIWLPIDSKYPVEHYQRLIDAHDTADKTLVQQAATAFENSIRVEAKKIASKYVSPPHTTDFAILFLPTEGLFAEVCRVPGMVEALQNDFRIVVAGPTTLSAMLNSLRLGFRTLVIEKRSSEVWNILSSIKTEFRKFGDIVDATHKSIDAAANKFKDIGVRTRAIERKLRDVEDLPSALVTGLLPSEVLGLEDDERAELAQ
jgi:DNA recombination protein RmuC